MPSKIPDHNPKALKHMYDVKFLHRIAEAFSFWKAFDRQAFLALKPKLLSLEMKPRVHLVRDELIRQLPEHYPAALKIVMTAGESKELRGFDFWPFTEFIQARGLNDFDLSLEALKILTVRFTSEFAVRPFLQKEPKRALNFLLRCSEDPDPAVRRWASEGSRPRLPWGMKLHGLIENPKQTLPILDRLKFDESMYVRKSVANHLNDIAKDHPELVIETLSKWKNGAREENIVRLNWITSHALRTLIKKGHPGALNLIGVDTSCKVKLKSFKLNQTVFRLHDRLEFQFTLQSLEPKPRKLVVDYRMHYQRSGEKLSEKVFKLKTFELGAGESLTLTKSHHLKPVTTRKHYSGTHHLEVLVNGVSIKKVQWELKA